MKATGWHLEVSTQTGRRFQRIYTATGTNEVIVRSGLVGRRTAARRQQSLTPRAEQLLHKSISARYIPVVDAIEFPTMPSEYHYGTVEALDEQFVAAVRGERAPKLERLFEAAPATFDADGAELIALPSWSLEVQNHPWADTTVDQLARCPHVVDASRDVALVVVAADTANQLSYLWSAQVDFGGSVQPGDGSAVLDTALRLWQPGGGSFEDLPGALEAARLIS